VDTTRMGWEETRNWGPARSEQKAEISSTTTMIRLRLPFGYD